MIKVSRLVIFAICVVYYRQSDAIAAEHGEPSTPEVFKFLASSLPINGEITAKETAYGSVELTKNARPSGPRVQLYHALWNQTDLFFEELPHDDSTGNKLKAVKNILIGQSGKTKWYAITTELNVDSEEGAPDTGPKQMVYWARTTLASFLFGHDFREVLWDDSHMKAKDFGGVSLEADLKNKGGRYQLTGKINEPGEVGEFRIEYHDFKSIGTFLYPSSYDFFSKYPGDADFRKESTVEILNFQNVSSFDPAVFTPDFHLERTAFRLFEYFGGKGFFMDPKLGRQPVVDIPPPILSVNSGAPRKILFWLVLFATAILLPFVTKAKGRIRG